MASHWSLDDIPWNRFDPAKVDPVILAVVKAAALVEANSPDYVTYLCNIFPDRPDLYPLIEQWGLEEAQHGKALARWAEMADPDFIFTRSLAQFRAGYSLPLEATQSVRGSAAGEMIARCIVEVGTSSFYSAIRDAAREPVLAEICRHIAADEMRHFRLFRDCLDNVGAGVRPPLFQRLRIAWGRIAEAEDDELSYAYYSANKAFLPEPPAYKRKDCALSYWAGAMSLYRRAHIDHAVKMVFRAVDLAPAGLTARLTSRLAWRLVSWWAAWLKRQGWLGADYTVTSTRCSGCGSRSR